MAGADERIETIEDWQRLRQGLTREQFAAKYPHPFLLRQKLRRTMTPVGAVAPVAAPIDEDWTERVAFETEVRDMAAASPAPAIGGRLRGSRVSPVVKVPGHPFPDRISVGRALNCDIVLREASVSKLHAHFKVLSPGVAELTDVRSANGTRLNGKPLAALAATRVSSGDSVLFGGVSVQFLDPRGFYDLL